MHTRTLFPKYFLFCSILFWGFANPALPAHAQPSGRELAQLVHDRYVGDDSVSRQTMELVPASGQKRVRQLNISVLEKTTLDLPCSGSYPLRISRAQAFWPSRTDRGRRPNSSTCPP